MAITTRLTKKTQNKPNIEEEKELYQDPLNQYNALKNYSQTKPLNIPSDTSKQRYLEDYSSIIANINNLYSRKYGVGNYDINKPFGEQNAQPNQNWTSYDENMALSEYEKLQTDLYNARYALDQYQNIAKGRQQLSAENQIIKEQAEKYLPNQLRMAGLGNVGSSEIPIGNIDDEAIKAYNALLQGTQEESEGLLGSYIEALKQSDQNLQSAKTKYQANLYSNFYNNLAEYDSPEKMNKMLEIAKKSLPAELYNNLLENAKLVAKEYGFDFEETLQKLETKTKALSNKMVELHEQGKFAEFEKLREEYEKLAKQLYEMRKIYGE
jgi:hypothetical protein